MSFLSDLVKKAKDRAGQVYDQINPLDNGKTYQQRTPVPAQAQPVRQAPQLQSPTVQRNPVLSLISKPAPTFAHLKMPTINTNIDTRGILSKGIDQINLFDNGRTFKQATPTNDRSIIGQAVHNGTTNVIGDNVVKPLVRSSLALNQGIGNAEVAAAHALGLRNDLKVLDAPTFVKNTGIPELQEATGYTGTKRQIIGDAVTNVANIAFPGSSKIAEAATVKLAPKVLPKIVPKLIGGAVAGAPAGAVSNVGTYVGSNEPLTVQGFAKNAAQGAIGGAVGGALFGVAPALIKGIPKASQTVRQLPSNISRSLEDLKTIEPAKAVPPVEAKIAQDLPTIEDMKLPEYATKRVASWEKAVKPTRSIIEAQGQHGRNLANLLRDQRDSQELYLGDLQKQIPTVMKLARKGRNALVNKDFENFVDATQGQALPKNLEVAQAIKEWQATHPAIRDRAVASGLEVGDLGPQYYPHFIDYDHIFKDKNAYNESINHLVKTGQAQTPEEAIKLLSYARDVSRDRQFGNLEASRLIDLPIYDKTPNSLISYLNGSTKRITNTETFGAKDEKALKLVAKAGQEGYDTEAMKNAYDIAIGAKRYNPNSEKVSGNIRKYITTTRLGLGALTNLSQNVNTGIVTGHIRTLGAILKQLDPKTLAFVDDTGTISDALLNDLKTQAGYSSFSSKVFGKAVNKITAPFFGTVERFNRAVAATAGRDYALRLAQTGKIDTLRKLRVTGEIKNGTLTEAQQVQAARAIVEKTQFKVDPQDLPGWADSPGGKLVSQFRTFSYNQHQFFVNEILKPASKGNVLPLARLSAALPLGYALYETKRAINGRPEEENKAKVGLAAFQNVGGAGLIFDLYNGFNPLGSQYLPSDRRVSMAVGTFGGPALGVAAQGVGGVSELIQRKNTPEDQSRLDGKLAIAKGEKYTDATPITRFALQQIPIVGGPIKNRVLPYKKESEADTGATKAVDNPKSLQEAIQSANVNTKSSENTFKAMFSKDDYSLYKLNNQERKKLIDSGFVDKAKFTGLDNYAKDKRKELGLTTVSVRPDNYANLDGDVQKFYDKKLDVSKNDTDAWNAAPADNDGKKLISRLNQIKGDNPDLPQTNKVASLYADFVANREKNKWSSTRENQEKKKLLQNAYKSELDDNQSYWLNASDGVFKQALANGDIDNTSLDKIVTYDNINVKLGGSQKISKKFRATLGIAQASGSSTGTSSGSSKRSSGGRTASPSTALNKEIALDNASTRSSIAVFRKGQTAVNATKSGSNRSFNPKTVSLKQFKKASAAKPRKA